MTAGRPRLAWPVLLSLNLIGAHQAPFAVDFAAVQRGIGLAPLRVILDTNFLARVAFPLEVALERELAPRAALRVAPGLRSALVFLLEQPRPGGAELAVVLVVEERGGRLLHQAAKVLCSRRPCRGERRDEN